MANAWLPPLIRQLGRDRLGLGAAAQSRVSASLAPRTQAADRVVPSVCPYCAVGCGQKVYVKDAERDGDSELADFFRRAQDASRKGGEQGKEALRKRL